MQKTFFDSRLFYGSLRGICLFLFRLAGWRVEGVLPPERKFVLIAAPHTSNWDFPLMLAVACEFRIRLFWMGKDSLFHGPMGSIMRWLGGVAIDRSQMNDMVKLMVGEIADQSDIALAIPPEGTRNRVRRWKSGFYHIADGACFPIVTGYLDYKHKVGGVGPTIYPTGNFESDMRKIREFYATISGKYPDKVSEN